MISASTFLRKGTEMVAPPNRIPVPSNRTDIIKIATSLAPLLVLVQPFVSESSEGSCDALATMICYGAAWRLGHQLLFRWNPMLRNSSLVGWDGYQMVGIAAALAIVAAIYFGSHHWHSAGHLLIAGAFLSISAAISAMAKLRGKAILSLNQIRDCIPEAAMILGLGWWWLVSRTVQHFRDHLSFSVAMLTMSLIISTLLYAFDLWRSAGANGHEESTGADLARGSIPPAQD